MRHLLAKNLLRQTFTVGVLMVFTQGCAYLKPRGADTSGGSPAAASPAWLGSLRGSALDGFQLSEQLERRGTSLITATNLAGDILKLERIPGLDADSASRLIGDGVMSLEALYANALSPYPGDLSNRVITDDGFHPRRAAGPREPWFVLFANDRFGFGVSTPEQVKYKALLGWVHSDSSEELFKIRLYVPANRKDAELRRWVKGIGAGSRGAIGQREGLIQ
ncbi:MAG: hypothetical protein JNN07_06020 [Verrucomicrobiales bacterium]|nr:hypothetical protein [Verrucomicrobiales bacterium]